MLFVELPRWPSYHPEPFCLLFSLGQVDNTYQQYRSGIYTQSTTANCNNIGTNHAQLIVGYNTTDPSNPYWIVQNSVSALGTCSLVQARNQGSP